MRRQSGFTLIEMTVAVALLGFISVLMFESLRFGQRSYESATRKGAGSWQVFATQRLLRNVVETAYPQAPDDTLSAAAPGLQGDAQRLRIIAPAPMAAGGAGLYQYDIALQVSASGSRDLVMRWRPQLADAMSATTFGAQEVLLERVAGLQLSYYTATGWTQQWTRSELPRLVRVQVMFARGDARRWPDLIAAPRVTDDANCLFDVVAQRCRRGA